MVWLHARLNLLVLARRILLTRKAMGDKLRRRSEHIETVVKVIITVVLLHCQQHFLSSVAVCFF